MAVHHNNILHNNHFRKDWQRRVKVWFDQAGAKKRRRTARQVKAAKLGLRPVQPLRPAVRCPTFRYNMKIRSGRGFTLEELKAAGIQKKQARSIGIPVDHRRRNKSAESLKINTDRLKAYNERLIVIPRKTKKNKDKKVDLSGVTAARQVQAVLPLPPSSVAEAPRAITAEEKEFEAYKHLRTKRGEHRQAGYLKARQQKKEEEAANAKK
ncbi:60S ribosomal protein L13 [Thecaphora frezii]